MRVLAVRTRSHQDYAPGSISPEFLVNGAPPDTPEYRRLVEDGFSAWRLEVNGLVETPLSLTLAELHQMPVQTQITKHHCIQGWSGIAEWGGIPVRAILDACHPLPAARFLIFQSYQLDTSGHPFYESLDMSVRRAA